MRLGKYFDCDFDRALKSLFHSTEELLNLRSKPASMKLNMTIPEDGSTFWANTVITPLYDDMQQLLGFSDVTRDLSRRKCLTSSFRKHRLRLKHLKKAWFPAG
jgi:hypothetical protein